MRRPPPPTMLLLQAWPTVAIVIGFIVPFGLLLQVSVSHRDPQGLWRPAFELTNFVSLFDRSVLYRLGYTAVLALLVAILSTFLAFPLASLIAGMRREVRSLGSFCCSRHCRSPRCSSRSPGK